MASVEELEEKLSQYKENFLQIETALKQVPNNEALLKAKSDLWEVINLTEDLLKLKKKPVTVSAKDTESKHSSASSSSHSSTTSISTSAPPSQPPPPSSDSDVIPSAQSPVKCMALYSDGQWYDAIIESYPETPDDKYIVQYVGYNERAALTSDEIRIRPTKEKRPSDETEDDKEDNFQLPKSLKILPEDSEEVRNAKRKKARAMKQQWRKKKMESERNNQKNAWKEFTQKASKQVKTGFLTGKTKESIFKSPDSVHGKVGVTGSGKGLTPGSTFNPTQFKKKISSVPDDE